MEHSTLTSNANNSVNMGAAAGANNKAGTGMNTGTTAPGTTAGTTATGTTSTGSDNNAAMNNGMSTSVNNRTSACGQNAGALPGPCAPLAFPYVPFQEKIRRAMSRPWRFRPAPCSRG